MVITGYKWWLWAALLFFGLPGRAGVGLHPFFVSVTEVTHNAKDKTLEISCKLFTDDFEKTLRQNYKTAVDLIQPKDRTAMNRLISDYIQKRLIIKADDKLLSLQFLGFEQQEEAIYSYWEVTGLATVKKIHITNTLLYDYKKEQAGILHVIVGGVRKSNRLINPDDKVVVEF
jgi:hypothetical protein